MPRPDGKKHVLYLSSNSCIGGVEQILLNILGHIDRSQYYTEVVITEIVGQLHDEYRAHCDAIHTIKDKDQFEVFLTRSNADVVHVFNSLHAITILDKLPGLKIISVFGDYRQPYGFFNIRREKFLHHMDQIDYMTTDALENLSVFDYFPHYIPNGIETPTYLDLSHKEDSSVVWIGRDSGEKRINALVETCKRLPSSTFHIALAALGPLSDHAKMLLDVPNAHVVQNATRAQVADMCRRSKIYLCTSMTEGTPLSMLEALSEGCIPVSSAVGGIPNVVNFLALAGAPVGRLVDQRDTVYDLHIDAAVRTWNKTWAQRIHDITVSTFGMARYMDSLYQFYTQAMPRNIKSSRLSRAAKIYQDKPFEVRLLEYVQSKPWDIDRNMDYAKGLYRALFDVELESSAFWVETVRNGYTRERFTLDLFNANKINSPRANACKGQLVKEIKARKYRDDNPNYIPR